MASAPEPSWGGKGERAPVCEPSGRAMGEIKPGDDRRVVNGLFLSLPLSPFPSPRLYSRSPRALRLITLLRDRRGHRGGRQDHSPSVRPQWPRWTAMPMAAPTGCVLGSRGVTARHPNAQPGLQPRCRGLGALGGCRAGQSWGRRERHLPWLWLDGGLRGCQHRFPASCQPLAPGSWGGQVKRRAAVGESGPLLP